MSLEDPDHQHAFEDSRRGHGPRQNVLGIPARHILSPLALAFVVFAFAFDAFAVVVLAVVAFAFNHLPLPEESAPTSIGTSSVFIVVEDVPDMTPDEVYTSPTVKKSLTKLPAEPA